MCTNKYAWCPDCGGVVKMVGLFAGWHICARRQTPVITPTDRVDFVEAIKRDMGVDLNAPAPIQPMSGPLPNEEQ